MIEVHGSMQVSSVVRGPFMSVLLIGQAPSASSDPKIPLSGASGRRLASLADLPYSEYLARFERVNLLNEYPGKGSGRGDAFNSEVLDDRARDILVKYGHLRLVFLGANVRTSFAVPEMPRFSWRKVTWIMSGGVCVSLCAWMPHPSEISGWWRNEANVEQAAEFMKGLKEL